MYFDGVFAQLLVAALGLISLKFLPAALKKFGFTKYLGDQGVMFIHVGAILYFGIIHIVLPIGSYVADKIWGLPNYLLPGAF